MSASPDGTKVEEQRMRWSKAIDYIRNLLKPLTDTAEDDGIVGRQRDGGLVRYAAQDIYEKLLKINLFWTYPILVKCIIDICTGSREVSLGLAYVASLVNGDVGEFGEMLCEQAMLQFNYYFQKRGNGSNDKGDAIEIVKRISSLLCELFNCSVVNELVVLQMLQLLVETLENNEEGVVNEITLENLLDIIVRVFEICGKKLSRGSKSTHDSVLQSLKSFLDEDGNGSSNHSQISGQLKRRISERIEAGRNGYVGVFDTHMLVNEHNDILHVHSFVLEADSPDAVPNFHLDEFQYTTEMSELDERYAQLRQTKVIGSTGGVPSQAMQAEARARKDEDDDVVAISKGKPTESRDVTVVQDRTNNEDIEFKKRIYLILKSSLSSDEAAHKLLLLRIPDDEKYRVVEVLIKSMIQEPTFSKFFGLLADKLCASHRSWKLGFERIFSENITQDSLAEFDPSQLRILGKFWGHLLSSDFLGFEILQQIKMNERDSTPPLRILVKFIFQELVYELGVDELKERLMEDHVRPYLLGVFPEENIDDLKYSINYFTAIGLGTLTEGMRDILDAIKQQEEEKWVTESEVTTSKLKNEMDQEKLVEPTGENKEVESRGRGQFRRRSKQELERSGKFPNRGSIMRPGKTPVFENTGRNNGSRRRERSITPPRRRPRFDTSSNIKQRKERSVTPPRKRRR